MVRERDERDGLLLGVGACAFGDPRRGRLDAGGGHGHAAGKVRAGDERQDVADALHRLIDLLDGRGRNDDGRIAGLGVLVGIGELRRDGNAAADVCLERRLILGGVVHVVGRALLVAADHVAELRVSGSGGEVRAGDTVLESVKVRLALAGLLVLIVEGFNLLGDILEFLGVAGVQKLLGLIHELAALLEIGFFLHVRVLPFSS